ncbi:MAG: hypothetical protein K2X42_07885 [Burkholderiaceae bacterium]|nr:hypothetical protein [Burkholderiaceae bacterium]
MTTETVLDYLGHPCQIAKAMDLFDYTLKESRALEPRQRIREIGSILNALVERLEHTGNGLEIAHKLLPHNSDEDDVRSVLAMAIPYYSRTASLVEELAGHVLAVMEHGKLVEVNHA